MSSEVKNNTGSSLDQPHQDYYIFDYDTTLVDGPYNLQQARYRARRGSKLNRDGRMVVLTKVGPVTQPKNGFLVMCFLRGKALTRGRSLVLCKDALDLAVF